MDKAFAQWQEQTQEALSKAHQEWVDAEATRLAIAEAHWRENIGIARSRGALNELKQHQQKTRNTGRNIRIGAFTALLVAAALAYPYLAPLISEEWWPKISAYKREVQPTVNRAGDQIQTWLSNATKPAPRMTVGVASANVRATPSKSAAVIATLPRNSEVVIIDRRQSWVRIRLDDRSGLTGWLHATLLRDLPAE